MSILPYLDPMLRSKSSVRTFCAFSSCDHDFVHSFVGLSIIEGMLAKRLESVVKFDKMVGGVWSSRALDILTIRTLDDPRGRAYSRGSAARHKRLVEG